MFFLIFKGRTWYSPHRGRLWIHAASKVPTDEEIAAVQQMYLQNGGQNDVKFPSNLPVSCLLGCVDVDDVIAQEEYREKYPKGESSSPFVFICTHPQELMLKYPMNGQHKICKYFCLVNRKVGEFLITFLQFFSGKMDPAIHKAVKKLAKTLH